jgi:TolA-binding protein
MKSHCLLLVTASALAMGCGASYAAPAQHLADAQSAERSAVELGAANQPKARLHLELAREQIQAAQGAIGNGDNEGADRLLARAKSDAELAIALTREEGAKVGAQSASTQSNNQRVTNANLGAKP